MTRTHDAIAIHTLQQKWANAEEDRDQWRSLAVELGEALRALKGDMEEVFDTMPLAEMQRGVMSAGLDLARTVLRRLQERQGCCSSHPGANAGCCPDTVRGER